MDGRPSLQFPSCDSNGLWSPPPSPTVVRGVPEMTGPEGTVNSEGKQKAPRRVPWGYPWEVLATTTNDSSPP